MMKGIHGTEHNTYIQVHLKKLEYRWKDSSHKFYLKSETFISVNHEMCETKCLEKCFRNVLFSF